MKTNPTMQPDDARDGGFSRRSFLQFAGLGAVGFVGFGTLAACSSDKKSDTAPSTSSEAADFGAISLQLSWIKNIEFAGEFMADSKGYYKEAGFSKVDLVTGPVDSADALVAANTVTIGLSAPDATARVITQQQAPLKIIASTYQKNPFCLVSLQEKTPIATVADLKGKKVGIQAGTNQTIFEGFLKANGMTTKDVTVVATQYDLGPLYKGDYDAHMSYLTNEPILAKSQGYTPVSLSFADNGLPLTAETYVVTEETLKNKKDMLKAFLVAEIKGWKDAIADPAASAKLAAETYGKDKGLKVDEQTEEATAQNELIVTDDTKANGLFTLTGQKQGEIVTALGNIGITITADELFDLSLLDEVYKEHPELKA